MSTTELIAALDKLTERIARLERAAKRPERDAWKPREVAEKLGIPYDTVLDLIKAGQIGHIPAGKHYLVPDAELQRFLSLRKTA
jgi:excisionase family DNA binding protein